MRVYHGGWTAISEIDLGKCRPNRDFGQGFYVTKIRKHAENWARTVGRLHNTEGVVTEFVFYDSAFTERLCAVQRFPSYNEEWLDFVINNRNPLAETHEYDIVEGPVANDKVQSRIFDYLQGAITKEAFLHELIFHEETHQICFCTLKSLLTLESTDKKHTSDLIHVCEPVLAALIHETGCSEIAAADMFYASNTFATLMSKDSSLRGKDWQQIYALFKDERKDAP